METKFPGIAVASARGGVAVHADRHLRDEWPEWGLAVCRRDRRSAPVHAASTTSLNATPCALRTPGTSSIGIEQNVTEREGVKRPLKRLRGAGKRQGEGCDVHVIAWKPAARTPALVSVCNARPARSGAVVTPAALAGDRRGRWNRFG